MKPIIYVYTESYYDTKRLFNILYRPCIDKKSLCTQKLWEDGEYFEIERDTEIWRICKSIEQEPYKGCISIEEVKQSLYKKLNGFDDELYDIFSKIIDDMYNELSSVVPQSKISKQVESEDKE